MLCYCFYLVGPKIFFTIVSFSIINKNIDRFYFKSYYDDKIKSIFFYDYQKNSGKKNQKFARK